MLIVGLTGGIASGKSTVSKLLSERHHLPIIDADLIARGVIEPGTSGYSLVVTHFGPDRILQEDGVSLDRGAIGDIIFHDPEERKWLNGVVHPRVKKEMVKRIIRYWLKGEWCVIVDVPLLIEAGMWKWVGDTVVVYVNERLQLSRLLSRQSNPPLTQSQASSRIASQLPLSAKLSYATSVIDNSGSFSDLNDQVDRTVAKWKAQQGGDSGWWWRVCWLVPPVGLVAGALSLLAIWRKSKKDRRRGRGEVSRRDGSEQAPERIELMELKGRRRRATNGSSVTDKE
ncbi:dephospho-CoA kinase [Cryptococcus neoformans var. grubii Br795]|nr:dephospho-CoA kinase [Cryptococcus neoformans var. grubii AD1-83a]OWZ55686.1 dephospho-CoA kinase [Cryptococcus neoformans var. grubii 125.91]OXG64716.1 dephospho-CoA kinase [Cryptococcus neoformans var. grubii MW-RSA1955]OXG67060.1 dephospho-CoA kinase [Cryptococcus neoformans var. grubii c8]OXG69865.1 dephospho-CoA kinase [Cryptococcus neoformans var. grubii CHC193]OXG86755.1 dephospho-CoA kinase [Cryptococcus neoformans var. grubii Br795]OXH15248.1 dephospho-CoA kinase [Cryptococcus neo